MTIKEATYKYLDGLKATNEDVMMIDDEIMVVNHNGKKQICSPVDLTYLAMFILRDEIIETKTEIDKYIKEYFKEGD